MRQPGVLRRSFGANFGRSVYLPERDGYLTVWHDYGGGQLYLEDSQTSECTYAAGTTRLR